MKDDYAHLFEGTDEIEVPVEDDLVDDIQDSQWEIPSNHKQQPAEREPAFESIRPLPSSTVKEPIISPVTRPSDVSVTTPTVQSHTPTLATTKNPYGNVYFLVIKLIGSDMIG